jgi:hypothetical protein
MLTPNETSITIILEWLLQQTDRAAAAMQRLLQQSISPEAHAASEKERLWQLQMQERREKQLGPPNPVNKGVVLPDLSADEIAEREQYQRQLRERAERLKKPEHRRTA